MLDSETDYCHSWLLVMPLFCMRETEAQGILGNILIVNNILDMGYYCACTVVPMIVMGKSEIKSYTQILHLLRRTFKS